MTFRLKAKSLFKKLRVVVVVEIVSALVGAALACLF